MDFKNVHDIKFIYSTSIVPHWSRDIVLNVYKTDMVLALAEIALQWRRKYISKGMKATKVLPKIPPLQKRLFWIENGGGGSQKFHCQILQLWVYSTIKLKKKKNYLNKPVKSEFLMTFIAKIGKKGSPECLSKQTTCQEAGSAHLRKWICLFIPRTMLLLVI